jgi:hypothetical protein
MKKTLLSLALLAGITSAAQAQTGLKLGLKGGFNGATFSGTDSKGSEYKAGFAAGGVLNYGFTDMFSVQGELLYSQKGGSRDGITYATGKNDGTTKTTLGYIDVPILLKVNAGDDGKGLFFEAGPQGSFVMHQRTFTEDGGGNQVGSSQTSTDALNKVVIGYVAGLGYQLTSGLGLGVRYTGDISQLYKDGTGVSPIAGVANPNVRNSVFQFQVHYMFGGK